jgi:hypothetical protein
MGKPGPDKTFWGKSGKINLSTVPYLSTVPSGTGISIPDYICYDQGYQEGRHFALGPRARRLPPPHSNKDPYNFLIKIAYNWDYKSKLR